MPDIWNAPSLAFCCISESPLVREMTHLQILKSLYINCTWITRLMLKGKLWKMQYMAKSVHAEHFISKSFAFNGSWSFLTASMLLGTLFTTCWTIGLDLLLPFKFIPKVCRSVKFFHTILSKSFFIDLALCTVALLAGCNKRLIAHSTSPSSTSPK